MIKKILFSAICAFLLLSNHCASQFVKVTESDAVELMVYDTIFTAYNELEQGKKQGAWVCFSSKEKVKSIVEFENGKRHGLYIVFDRYGEIFK